MIISKSERWAKFVRARGGAAAIDEVTHPLFAVTLLFFLVLVARLCLKPLEQLSYDDWMTFTAVFFISIALLISHRVHMLTGR